VTLSVAPWPSDHRAVVSTFLAKPARTPRLVSPGRRIFGLDDDIVIAYRNAPDSSIEIPGIGSYKVSGSGELRLAAQERDRKYYDVELHTPGQTIVRSGFWVVDRSAIPTVRTARTTYDVGETIDISWRNGPGNRNDYLGIYEIGIESAYIAGYDGGLTWLYVNAEPEGTLQLSQDSSQVAWPLPAGRYVARLLKDDGYEVLAESQPFVVR